MRRAREVKRKRNHGYGEKSKRGRRKSGWRRGF